MSDITASICAVTRSADSASKAVTPSVFCAVTAVMALSAVDAVRGKRLEVGLDAGAAARIAAGDCQRRTHGRCRCTDGSIVRELLPSSAPEPGQDAGGSEQLDEVGGDERIHTGHERGLQADRRAVRGRARTGRASRRRRHR